MMPPNRDRLQAVVEGHMADQRSLAEFSLFHLSVVQKVWSVDLLADEIAKVQPALKWGSVVYNDPGKGQTETDIADFGRRANLLLDCFLMNSMACLDTLAHEIKVIYSLSGDSSRAATERDRFYIRTVKNDLLRDHEDCKLTRYLKDELSDDGWFKVFSTYRHCTTHESLIGSNIHLDIESVTGNLREVKVPLPDDPRQRPFKYRHRRELRPYCEKTRRKVNFLIDRCYQLMVADIEAAEYAMPIPPNSTRP